MAERQMRNLIRALVGAVLSAALVAGAAAPIPEDLPAVACRQEVLYRLEIALLVFYGGLLLITPTFSGLIGGRLPTEISTRGAKFVEEATHSDEATEVAVQQLELYVGRLADRVTNAEVKIDRRERDVTISDRQ